MESSEPLSLKNLYKRQKEIINKIQDKEKPDISQIELRAIDLNH